MLERRCFVGISKPEGARPDSSVSRLPQRGGDAQNLLVDALFTSLAGGDALRDRVVGVLRSAASEAAQAQRVDVHVMTFSFTDDAIAGVLVDLARAHENVSIRVIADWGQGSEGHGRQLRRLELASPANLFVRYKHDQPYEWDPVRRRPRWSYRASRGLLHHKTLGVFVDGAPSTLVCGSFNWTRKAARSYENLLVLGVGDAALMQAVEDEFEAMWRDGRATLSPEEAHAHYEAVMDEYRRDPALPPRAVVGLTRGADSSLDVTDAAGGAFRDGRTIAFSSRSPHQARAEAGYAPGNRARRLELRKPGGATKHVPLTLTNVALDVIARAQRGDRLLVAMYGISHRVPEYGALLDAARRGVRLQVLLDGDVGRGILYRFGDVAYRERLPLQLRAAARMMHQKYIVHPESDTVLTGTANLSTDASARHTEHRFVLRHDAKLAAQFSEDFAAVWSRTKAPFGALLAGR
jgi:phosphatidylserine/phosphatidylglycerophosphate/cardiolipin synthase-like enzyme